MRRSIPRGIAWVVAGLGCLGAGLGVVSETAPLYLVDGTFSGSLSRVFSVDPASGVLELKADLGTAYTPVLGMAAADRTSLYMAASDNTPTARCGADVGCIFMKVDLDPASTIPALIQEIGVLTENGSTLSGMTGLTFRNDGQLYGLNQNTNGLYLIDLATAVATRIGTVDLSIHGGDLTFDASDRLWIWSNIGQGSGLYEVDPVTAHATLFDPHPDMELTGLAALGHGPTMWGSNAIGDRIHEMNSTVGFTGTDFLMTLDGIRFNHSRGDLDSPFCEDAAACADQNACTTDQCSPGGCENPPEEDGFSCDDGDACTQIDGCQDGTCSGGNPVVCQPPDACHDAGTCDPTSGNCENAPEKPDGALCDDGNACTTTDSCQTGICTGGTPVVCPPPGACHEASTCNPASGICELGAVLPDGTTCDDGNACSTVDACAAGVCSGGSPVVCPPPDACHEASACNPGTGLCGDSSPKPEGTSCTDGNACTVGDACFQGACVSGPPPDMDGDGRVDALCAGTDCNDANPFVWSSPVEVTALTFTSAADFSWDGQAALTGPETSYDVVSGYFSGAQGFGFVPSACLQAGGGVGYSDSRTDPSMGEGFWYLVRGRNSCGTGSFGSSARDASITSCNPFPAFNGSSLPNTRGTGTEGLPFSPQRSMGENP